MGKQVTVRGVSPQLAQRLKGLAKARGESVNSTVLRILEQATGSGSRRERLATYVTWSAAEAADFDAKLRDIRRVDDELWR